MDVPAGYRLVFSDEFDQPTLRPRNWSVAIDGKGGGNFESQYYTAEAVSIQPDAASPTGHKGLRLTIAPIVRPDLSNVSDLQRYLSFDYGSEWPSQRYYTSGKVTTQGLHSFQYGLFSVRAKLPSGSHAWPAVWLLPDKQRPDSTSTVWPNYGEIDIVEQFGSRGAPGTVHGCLNYGTSPTEPKSVAAAFTLPETEGDFSTDFHVFSLLWQPDSIRWYVDGQLYSTKTAADLEGGQWPFGMAGNTFYLILNAAIGGTQGGLDVPPRDQLQTNGCNYSAIDVTASNYVQRAPQVLIVDYVRVYQPADALRLSDASDALNGQPLL